jgi:hypothetical protein
MTRILSLVVALLAIASLANAQNSNPKPQSGTPLATQVTVGNSVTAQAVLIPRIDARRIFGEEIANNYAVIEVNVGNKSPDAALIIHGIFIDYSNWALSGNPSLPSQGINGVKREDSNPWQADTTPSQVASEEYRVVRGQLLDAQMWSKRNWTVRLLTFAGQLASGYAFSVGEQGIIRGLNAFSGVAVPGLKEAWPDGTIEQLNRVSDFGYQANKVIPKQGAEVIVCFFPIDRFLTPGFKKLFLKSPALFFSPLQMLVDKSLEKDTEAVLKGLNKEASLPELRRLLPCYLSIMQELHSKGSSAPLIKGVNTQCFSEFGISQTVKVSEKDPNDKQTVLEVTDGEKFKNFQVLSFIGQMSLNAVSVKIDGAMAIDTTVVPGKIDAIQFDKIGNCAPTDACFWTDTTINGGVRTGSLPGSYLTNGGVVIAEDKTWSITDITAVTTGSSDQQLNFSFKLTKPIPPQTSLHFSINKPQPGTANNGKTIGGIPREYLVSYSLSPLPHVTGVKQDPANKLAVTGTNFIDIQPDFPLVVRLHGPNRKAVEVKPDSITPTTMKLTVPDDLAAGCWFVLVYRKESAETRPDSECYCFYVAPKPVLTSAKRKGETIEVEGEDLIDTSTCGGPRLSFQLTKDGGTPVTLKRLVGTATVLNLPAAAKDGTWKLTVLLNGTKVPNQEVTLTGP